MLLFFVFCGGSSFVDIAPTGINGEGESKALTNTCVHLTQKYLSDPNSMAQVRKFSPRTLAAIDEAARVVFGNRPVVPYRTDFKMFKRVPYGAVAQHYYVPDMVPTFRKYAPDFKTDLEERREEKLVRLRARNKGPPKKGEGKRAKKRGKK